MKFKIIIVFAALAFLSGCQPTDEEVQERCPKYERYVQTYEGCRRLDCQPTGEQRRLYRDSKDYVTRWCQ